jgi:hypothetical protein
MVYILGAIGDVDTAKKRPGALHPGRFFELAKGGSFAY